MKETLELINMMLAEGVISDYAIGGAVGATFYLAPAATVDLDLFVTLPGAPGFVPAVSIYFLRPCLYYIQDKRNCKTYWNYAVDGRST